MDISGLNSSLASLRGNALGYKLENFLEDKLRSSEFWNSAQSCANVSTPCSTSVNPAINYGTITLSQSQNFIKRLYRKVLGREVDANGLTYHSNRIFSETDKPAMHLQVIRDLLKSKEYIDAFVTSQFYYVFNDIALPYQTYGSYYHDLMFSGTYSQFDVITELFSSRLYWDKAMFRSSQCANNACTLTSSPLQNFTSLVGSVWHGGTAVTKPPYTYYMRLLQN